jgi:hypothetical protein
MKLRLKVDRSALTGHERTLVDALFFDNRTETDTELVKAHYKGQGFNPAAAIRPELEAAAEALMSSRGNPPRAFRLETLLVFLGGVGVLMVAWIGEGIPPAVPIAIVVMLVVACAGWIAGALFRSHMHWGRKAALACLIPAVVLAVGLPSFLWFLTGTGTLALSPMALLGLSMIGAALIMSAVNALKSRRHPQAIALRKRLAAGREFLESQVPLDTPALRDEWFPWVLAFGLGPSVDRWSTRLTPPDTTRERDSFEMREPFDRDTSPTPSTRPWGGFGGGRSGGAGASATWAVAASGMVERVAPPGSSSGSGGSSGSSDDSSGSSWGGGSSGSSSSGGGGGGGW